MTKGHVRVQREIAGKTVILETGLVAKQSAGSVMATIGETIVLANVNTGPARDDIDFFPLTVDYREKTEAAGKIPGGFFKREARPTTKETLTMRLIDRSIRPMFPDGFRQECQVFTQVISYDGVNAGDTLAMIAAFAAIHISPIPFNRAMGATRIGMFDGEQVAFPDASKVRLESDLDLVVAGHADAIAMVEASANQLPEADMIDALELAHDTIKQICELVDELRSKAGKEKFAFVAPAVDTELKEKVDAYADQVRAAQFTEGKFERYAAVGEVKKACVAALTAGIEDAAVAKSKTKEIKELFSELTSRMERETILEGRRVDGRSHTDIREITIIPNFIPRQHGSVLFTRGETQAIVSTTLGTRDDEQIIDGIDEEYRKNFYLHYNFPPYSVGETRRFMGPGRREIGHGMLAERSLQPVLPSKEAFPYTMRIVSDITESNGSSSMASVCGGCLSLMLAGVPVSQPIAGIAMGLVQEGDRTAILSDILGSEDHSGDMDFKVSGSGLGLTALQMDIKIKGVTRDLLVAALDQAREGRIHILKKMLEVVPRPNPEVSLWAPKMESLNIPQERIGFLIGPGGRNIKGIEADYGVRVAVTEEGRVTIAGIDRKKLAMAFRHVQGMCEAPEIGGRYTGTVRGVKDFGAFIEILPGTEGMCHISELADGYVDKVTDVVNVGDEVEVVVINVDDRGKIKLSIKQAAGAPEEETEEAVN
ncbi:Polyribonucleotide nucleotidyltransferase [Planctomycetes bacterium Pla163]|uniref:Polyribonucleotide nucleotidyltransferase n=1 Tax=Rohdeia mirabilis TaxID=2528008 RepID=A0A518D397_9BACT|nr:Polyribonucleotide nucleotidyltransferase [Planctomycetes bacterium Pla163]